MGFERMRIFMDKDFMEHGRYILLICTLHLYKYTYTGEKVEELLNQDFFTGILIGQDQPMNFSYLSYKRAWTKNPMIYL